MLSIGVVRRISNFENPESGPRFDEFVVGKADVPLFQGQNGYLHNGMLMPDEVKAMSDGLIKMYEQSDGVNRAARLMIQMQRRIAQRPQSPVGEDAMVLCRFLRSRTYPR